jgi:hypothetical protein
MTALAANSWNQPRTVYARFYSGLVYSGTSDTIIWDTINPTVATPVLAAWIYSGIYYRSTTTVWAVSRISDSTAINTWSCGLYYNSAWYVSYYLYTWGLHFCYNTWAGPGAFNTMYSFAIKFQAWDKATNTVISSTWTFYRDDSWPACTISINTWATYTSTGLVDLYMYCTDKYTLQFFPPTTWWAGTYQIWYWETWHLNYVTYNVWESNLYLVTWFQLSAWTWLKTIYVEWVDHLTNTWSQSTGAITLVDPTVVYTWYISSWTTWNNWSTLYYRW